MEHYGHVTAPAKAGDDIPPHHDHMGWNERFNQVSTSVEAEESHGMGQGAWSHTDAPRSGMGGVASAGQIANFSNVSDSANDPNVVHVPNMPNIPNMGNMAHAENAHNPHNAHSRSAHSQSPHPHHPHHAQNPHQHHPQSPHPHHPHHAQNHHPQNASNARPQSAQPHNGHNGHNAHDAHNTHHTHNAHNATHNVHNTHDTHNAHNVHNTHNTHNTHNRHNPHDAHDQVHAHNTHDGTHHNNNSTSHVAESIKQHEEEHESSSSYTTHDPNGTQEQPLFGTSVARSKAFEVKLEELIAYKALKGDCRVPKQYPPNPSLAYWCNNQRRQLKLRQEGKPSSMTDERESALDAVGFWWGLGRMVHWEDRLEQLKQLKKEQASSDNRPKKKGDVNRQLAEWQSYQRAQYHDGALSKEREQALRDIGFNFGVRRPKWNDFYNRLAEYKEKHGNCDVTLDSGEEHKDLLNWVNRQRANYIEWKKAGDRSVGINEERVSKLEKLGFKFTTWDVKFAELLKFKETHGHCRIATGRMADENDNAAKGLRNWVLLQREHYKRWRDQRPMPSGEPSPMTVERVEALLKAGFEFEPKQDPPPLKEPKKECLEKKIWKKRISELRSYKDVFGDCNVPSNFRINHDLAAWVGKLHSEYKFIKEHDQEKEHDQDKPAFLTVKRVEELQDLGFDFQREQCQEKPATLKIKIGARETASKKPPNRLSPRKKKTPKKIKRKKLVTVAERGKRKRGRPRKVQSSTLEEKQEDTVANDTLKQETEFTRPRRCVRRTNKKMPLTDDNDSTESDEEENNDSDYEDDREQNDGYNIDHKDENDFDHEDEDDIEQKHEDNLEKKAEDDLEKEADDQENSTEKPQKQRRIIENTTVEALPIVSSSSVVQDLEIAK